MFARNRNAIAQANPAEAVRHGYRRAGMNTGGQPATRKFQIRKPPVRARSPVAPGGARRRTRGPRAAAEDAATPPEYAHQPRAMAGAGRAACCRGAWAAGTGNAAGCLGLAAWVGGCGGASASLCGLGLGLWASPFSSLVASWRHMRTSCCCGLLAGSPGRRYRAPLPGG